MLLKKAIFPLAIALISLPVVAQPKYPQNLFAVSQMRVDSTRAPHGVEWYLQSREAKAIVGSIATYMGINPAYVTLATSAVPSSRQEGEETFYDLPVPNGYAFCSTRIGVRSIVPADGGRASVINAVAREESVGVYTWTPVRQFGEGRSWVEADVQVTGILPQYLAEFRSKGVCKAPGTQILGCRGNPCSGVEWGRIQDAGPTTSDLTQGF